MRDNKHLIQARKDMAAVFGVESLEDISSMKEADIVALGDAVDEFLTKRFEEGSYEERAAMAKVMDELADLEPASP